jgi:hypothetical protein
MFRRLLLTVFAIALAGPLTATDRPAWLLTAEERVALRYDGRKAAERRRIAATRAAPGMPPPELVIDGSANPELFLPSELMAFLLSSTVGAHADPQRSQLRALYGESLETFGWDAETFWSDFERSATTFIALTANDDEARPPDRSRLICASRAASLTAMRARYPRFDEFLYRAVAPHNQLSSERPPEAEWLLWVESGCR